MAAFEEAGVAPELIRAVEELGWVLPTPIQQECVPLVLGGGDVLGAAETGSGKTGAFALPLLQVVHEALQDLAKPAAGGAGGASVRAEDCVLNADDRDAYLAVSPEGDVCQARSQHAWAGGRGAVGAVSGKHYFEVSVRDEGLVRVGWATLAASLELGTDRQGFGYGGTGKKSHGRQFEDYGGAYGKGDVVGCLLDADGGTVSFTKNGAELGEAYALPDFMRGQAIYPAVCLKNAEAGFNFGLAPFAHGPPAGYQGLAQARPGQTVSAAAAAAAAEAQGVRAPRAIILEPARDLAEQTHDCIVACSKYLQAPSLSSALMVGGTDMRDCIRALKEGVDIVTGTPGRIMDLVEGGKLSLASVRFFVLDEADRLLDTGNSDTIMKLFNRFPKSGTGTARLQVLLFSATLHAQEVKDLSAKICVNPVWVDLKGKDSVPDTVHHVLVRVNPKADGGWAALQPAAPTDSMHVHDSFKRDGSPPETPEACSHVIKAVKPHLVRKLIDTLKMDQCMIFCRTNHDCDQLEQFFITLGGGGGKFRGLMEKGKENPYSCVVLGGARSMEERRRNLSAFKEGDVRFLICTDVAARGLDIKELPYVINVTLPDKPEDYVHRIGRVGRADCMGLAVSLVATEKEKVWFCSKKGYKPWLQPSKQDVKLNDQGGHTIWYDEPDLLTQVEARIQQKIHVLGPDLKLPPEMAAAASVGGEGGATQYGKARSGGFSSEASKHMEQLRPNVGALAELEVRAQGTYWALKKQFVARAN